MIFCLTAASAAGSAQSPDLEIDLQNEADTLAIPSDDMLAELLQFQEVEPVLRTAIILSDIYSKKDMEFTRGFLLGIKEAQLPDNSLSLKVINGEVSQDSLHYELDQIDPHVIFTTSEKGIGEGLLTYALEHNCLLINCFDVKAEEYMGNPFVYQVLSPSSIFNGKVSRTLVDLVGDANLIIIGEPEPTDQILRDMLARLSSEKVITVPATMVKDLAILPGETYFIYVASPKGPDVKKAIAETTTLQLQNPSSQIKLLGRPNWVAFNDFNTLTGTFEAYVPTRAYFDPSAPKEKQFIRSYHELYGRSPIRSYPVYAAMGYDVAQYFVPLFVIEQRSDNEMLPRGNMLQVYFNLVPSDSAHGLSNNGSYLLHLQPWGAIDKITID